MLNELHEAHTQSTSQLILGETLIKLADYTQYHFSTEEDLFTKYNYPACEKHIDEHKEFINSVSTFRKEAEKGNLLLSLKTIDFLKDWTINHILGTDKEFGDFIHEKELGI